ncbi:MAG: acyltransferase [Betaproteobacteria bacterium]
MSTPPDMAPLAKHFPALDGLRGIAILLVLVHMFNLLGAQDGVAAYLSSRVSYFGWTGVQLFFALSGFLITGLLLDTQRAGNYFSGFYARRALRIFPLYFAVLALAFIVLPAVGIMPAKIAADQPNQVWLWTYLTNLAGHFDMASKGFPHFWSLAVEEQFYLVWPFLMYARSPTQCVRLCVAAAVASLALRIVLASMGTLDDMIYHDSFCRMDALALGAAAAAAMRVPAYRQWLIARHRKLLVAAAILLVAGALVTQGFRLYTFAGETVGYTFISLEFVLLLIAAVCAESEDARGWVRVLRWGPLRAVGKYSYAMYLFHKPLHDYVGRPLVTALGFDVAGSVMRNAAYMLVATLVTFALAVLSWHLFEKHFLKLKIYFAARP